MTIHETLAALTIPLGSVTRYPGNARAHQIDRLRESLRNNGMYRPLVVNRRTMQILAGNGTHEAAEQEGWTEIAATFVDVDDEQAQRILLVDNPPPSHPGYDDEALLELLQSLPDIGGTGYTSDELAELEGAVRGEQQRPGFTDPDEVPEPPAEPVTKPGDLWLLGPHRLLCGDATVVTDAERLMGGALADCMWTDPPYGVKYEGGSGLTIINDEAGGLPELLRDAFFTASMVLKPGAAVYVAHPAAGMLSFVFTRAFVEAGWRLHQRLVWVKDQMVLGHSDYHFRHEDLLFGYTAGEGRRGRSGEGWYGDHAQTSVFEVPKPKRSETAPIMKPVDLIAPALLNSCPAGGTVLDLFGGSGSTLIAAHSVSRIANLLELDPTYCDVIARRWQEHTGEKPILEATGEPYDFTSAP